MSVPVRNFVIRAKVYEMFLYWHVIYRKVWLGETLGKIRVEEDIKKSAS